MRTGVTIRYVITVTNHGPGDVSGALVRNRFPHAVGRTIAWSCVATDGSRCTATATDLVIQDLVDIKSGGRLVYSVDAVVRRSASGTLRNSAEVVPPARIADPDLTNNTSTDVTRIVRR